MICAPLYPPTTLLGMASSVISLTGLTGEGVGGGSPGAVMRIEMSNNKHWRLAWNLMDSMSLLSFHLDLDVRNAVAVAYKSL